MIKFIRVRNNITTIIIINTDYVTNIICSAPDKDKAEAKLKIYLMNDQYPYEFEGNEAYQVLDALKNHLETTIELYE